MSTIAKVQREFLDSIVTEVAGPGAAHVRGGKLAPSERLAVYSRNVFANWRAALADTFPVVERLVGPAFFTEAARQYGITHPSTSGDLHQRGRWFADFLAQYPHASQLPYLPDVARLEWACHEAFHAAPGAAFDQDALARVPASRHEAIRFRLHPAVRLVRSPHPVAAIWHANQEGRDGTPDRVEGPDCVLVQRPEYEVRVECIASGDWDFLAAIASGATLGEAAGELGMDDRLGEVLRAFVAARVIDGFTA